MRVLIADDEAPARARVRQLLTKEADFEIVAEAANGDDALENALTLRPQLLFLDVEMPAADGLTVLQEIRQVYRPKVIFTTAHAEAAVEAFNLEATDYLLKPFSRPRFAAALNRARRATASPFELPSTTASTDRLLIKSGNRYRVVNTDEILSVQAAANYVVLRTRDGKHIMRRTLRQISGDLCAKRFYRTSRSTIANLTAIREVKPTASGAHTIILSDGSDLPLTSGLRELESRLRELV